MRQHRIKLLLERLYEIDRKLGGKAQASEQPDSLREFEQLFVVA